MIFSGIADEAGTTIEQQIKAHQELGWEYIELRMVDCDGFVSIEPHLASVIHNEKMADKSKEPYSVYLEYGRRLMKVAAEIESIPLSS